MAVYTNRHTHTHTSDSKGEKSSFGAALPIVSSSRLFFVHPIRQEILGGMLLPCDCLSGIFALMKAIISGLTETKMVGAHSVGTYCPNSPSPVSHVLALSTDQQMRSLGEMEAMQPRAAPLI